MLGNGFENNAWNAENVKDLRRRLGVTQSQLAQRLGVRQQTVSEWETGLYSPRGASVTLLRMVSEETGPEYRATSPTDFDTGETE